MRPSPLDKWPVIGRLRRMPETLGMLSGILLFFSTLLIPIGLVALAIAGIDALQTGKTESLSEALSLVALGVVMFVVGYSFFAAFQWIRYFFPIALAALALVSLTEALHPIHNSDAGTTDADPHIWYDFGGAAIWSLITYWYFFRNPNVRHHFGDDI